MAPDARPITPPRFAPAPAPATAPAGGLRIKLPAILGGVVPEGAEPEGGKRAPSVLTEREAKALHAQLVKSYLILADSADGLITRTNRKREEAHIWSTMDEEDAGTLAEIAIEHGMRSPLAAQAVRGLVKTSKYVKAGLIVGPRAWDTLLFYARNGGVTLWL